MLLSGRTMLRAIADMNATDMPDVIDAVDRLLVFCTKKFGVNDPEVVNLRESLRALVLESLHELKQDQLLRFGAFYYLDANPQERWKIFKEITKRNLIREWNEVVL